jgi:hypothetical protein
MEVWVLVIFFMTAQPPWQEEIDGFASKKLCNQAGKEIKEKYIEGLQKHTTTAQISDHMCIRRK